MGDLTRHHIESLVSMYEGWSFGRGLWGMDPVWVVNRRRKTESGRLRPFKFYVYTEEAAGLLGKDWVPYRESVKGDLAITDDGIVSELLGRYNLRDGNAVNYVFPWGKPIIRGDIPRPLHARPFLEKRAYHSTVPRSIGQWTMRKKEYQEGVKLFCRLYFITGGDLTPDQCQEVAKRFSHYGRRFIGGKEWLYKFINKNPTLRQACYRVMNELLAKAGITPEKVVGMMKKTFDKAEELEDVAEMRRMSQHFWDIHDRGGASQAIVETAPLAELEAFYQDAEDEMPLLMNPHRFVESSEEEVPEIKPFAT